MIPEFIKARNEALLSLDELKIKAYMAEYGINFNPSCSEVFWRAVHKARTAIPSLPDKDRQLSEDWLREHHSESWKDKH